MEGALGSRADPALPAAGGGEKCLCETSAAPWQGPPTLNIACACQGNAGRSREAWLGSQSYTRDLRSERVTSRLDGCHADAPALGQTGAVRCAKLVTEMGYAKHFCCTPSDPREVCTATCQVQGLQQAVRWDKQQGRVPSGEVILRSCLTAASSQCCPCTQGM